MKKHTFKVGDRVRIRAWDDMANEFGRDVFGNIECKLSFVPQMKHLCGREYMIEKISASGQVVLKNYTEYYSISTDMLEPASLAGKVVIYQNGDEVIAKDCNTGKTAKAVCSKDDVFEFSVGAKLALDRLTASEPPKLLNCRFVVTESKTKSLTVGKIYEVKDGFFYPGGVWGDHPAPMYNNALKTEADLLAYLGSEGLDGRVTFDISAKIKICIIKE